jgi:glutathione peroxidase
MNRLFVSTFALLVAAPLALAFAQDAKSGNIHAFTLKNIDGEEISLADYKGKVVLLVNVASKCGLTPQYEGLQALYEKYKDKGLVVVVVPANEFGNQEPGTNAQIKEFCKLNYDVTFPMLSKIVVKGLGIHPLYAHLTSKESNPKFAGDIAWNFTKFLVDKDGNVIARFEPRTTPDSDEVVKAIEAALGS